jgi:hypothetical protein
MKQVLIFAAVGEAETGLALSGDRQDRNEVTNLHSPL